MRQEDVKHEFVRYTRGYGLDIGHGMELAFPHFIGIREVGDIGARAPHIPVQSFDSLDPVDDAKCDFIVAADVARNRLIPFAEWFRCLRDGGHLCLYEPKRAADGLAYEFDSSGLDADIVRCEAWCKGGAFIVLKKGPAGRSYTNRRPAKTACVVRHGGIGDMLQAAYLLPQLKRDGYHVTMLTSEKGRNIVREDPNIDEWYMIDDGQVPNLPGRNELAAFWRVTALHYDKFVNLSESVEGTFLSIPGRPQHAWPYHVRQMMLNRNYAEFAAALADTKFVPEGRFWPTAEETADAKLRVAAAANVLAKPLTHDAPVFVMMWVLAGSSPHKFTPHQDTVLRMIMGTLKRAVVIMVGDDACKILEAGWEEEPRIVCRSGELSVRDTLALAQQMDLVIGPETGVMNAICYEQIPKVLMLSHSSHENLSKHWVNTYPIAGRSSCYPCHQLHYSAEFCPTAKSGGAACQDGVDPMLLFAPICKEYEGWAKVKMLRAA